MLRRFLTVALLGIGTALPAGAQAPAPVIDPSFLNEGRALAGDSIRLCINGDSLLAPFDRDVAQLLADSLLLQPQITELNTAFAAPAYDYRVQIEEPQLFVDMTNTCDALLGYRLSPTSTPDWLTVSAPYFRSRSILATLDPSLASLKDLLPDAPPVGARLGAPGDSPLRIYLQTTGVTPATRLGYLDNDTLLQKLADGTISVALVWEPALLRARDTLLAGLDVRILNLPFDAGIIEFGIAFHTSNAFLRTAFDQAISALTASGALDALAARHDLRIGPPAP